PALYHLFFAPPYPAHRIGVKRQNTLIRLNCSSQTRNLTYCRAMAHQRTTHRTEQRLTKTRSFPVAGRYLHTKWYNKERPCLGSSPAHGYCLGVSNRSGLFRRQVTLATLKSPWFKARTNVSARMALGIMPAAFVWSWKTEQTMHRANINPREYKIGPPDATALEEYKVPEVGGVKALANWI
ncbi:unnamed protein product, partial [Chrysoparadoxa australica]